MNVLYIAIAGAIGSVCRHLAGSALHRATAAKTALPIGTLVVNVVGCFAIGAVMAVFIARGEPNSRLRLAVTTGFLGGFTTYSAFALETVSLIEQQRAGIAAIYVATTLVAGAAACGCGLVIGKALAS